MLPVGPGEGQGSARENGRLPGRFRAPRSLPSNAMETLLIYDDRFLAHDPGRYHPESPSRLRAIAERLAKRRWSAITAPPEPASDEMLLRVHEKALVDRIRALAGHSAQLDPDTTASPGSAEAALLAAGAATQAVRRVIAGEAKNAFALVRPPGHHAEADRAMGFCFFNNAAVAVAEAHAMGLERVLCLDWDVHHGNGTQHSFYARRDLLYMSTHQFPFYPGTGALHEIGRGAGEGYTVNVPLEPGAGDADFAAIFADVLLPVAEAYRPELVIVSAGFDAHRADPLGNMQLSTEGYAALCGSMKSFADRICGGKLVLTLEGGYDLDALAESVEACVDVLTGATPPSVKPDASPRVAEVISNVGATLHPYWPNT